MPVAGRPRNPLHQRSDRFHRNRLLLMERRQDYVPARTAEPGTIRRLIRGLVAYTGAAPAFGWTRNGFAADPAPNGVTTAPERYTVTTTNVLTAGNQLSNPMRRTVQAPRVLHPPIPLAWAGNRQGMPTVRNRIASFGSRVRPLNAPSPDAQGGASS